MTTETNQVATIRRATLDDLPRVEQLLVASDLPTAGVAEALPGFLVAEYENELVGVVGGRGGVTPRAWDRRRATESDSDQEAASNLLNTFYYER